MPIDFDDKKSNEGFDPCDPEEMSLFCYRMRHGEPRVPSDEQRARSLADYISNVRRWAENDVRGSDNKSSDNSGLVDLANTYEYLRKVTGAQTLGDALDALSRGEIDQGVVHGWIDTGSVLNGGLFQAVRDGYPSLRDELTRANAAFRLTLEPMLGDFRKASLLNFDNKRRKSS